MNAVITQIRLKSGAIACYRWGQGENTIVALHGFGERAHSFSAWGEALPEGFSLFAPDLPLHGSSRWEEGARFSLKDLRELIWKMTGKKEPFILCGYSMGGRLALSYYQHYPREISRLALFAPDGLKVNFWYWLSTQTAPGNRLFRFTMKHPTWFTDSVRFFGKYGLLNQGIVKYVQRYLDKDYNRLRLYRIWTCMRSFRPNLEIVRRCIRKQRTPVCLVFGHFDRIIQPSQGYRFQKRAGSTCRVEELATGHQLLAREFTEACLEFLTA